MRSAAERAARSAHRRRRPHRAARRLGSADRAPAVHLSRQQRGEASLPRVPAGERRRRRPLGQPRACRGVLPRDAPGADPEDRGREPDHARARAAALRHSGTVADDPAVAARPSRDQGHLPGFTYFLFQYLTYTLLL